MLTITADENIYKLTKFLPEKITLKLFDPNSGLPDLTGTDILLVRTVTQVGQKTLSEVPKSLKVVGTASAGTDHIDFEYLKKNNVKVIDAKGSNAQAVSEYVITSILLWSIKRHIDIKQLSFGVVGAGKTGSAVIQQLESLGLNYYCYDPPREQREEGFQSCSLEEVLSCDVLTFHTPLTRSGDYSTHHWFNKNKLADRSFKLVINAARGGVIDEAALRKGLDQGGVQDIIIDVWENEPDFNTELAKAAFIATPHIAGYSEQAKLNATLFLLEKLAKELELTALNKDHLYTQKKIKLASLSYSLYEVLLRINPIKEYDAELREISSRSNKSLLFQKLRTDRPLRFEYPYLCLENNSFDSDEILKNLGINIKKR